MRVNSNKKIYVYVNIFVNINGGAVYYHLETKNNR